MKMGPGGGKTQVQCEELFVVGGERIEVEMYVCIYVCR